ncbi:MAG: 50S ribosomal protein L13 [Firmicutes bacterium]|nr:50S ribosomal protein L13 [Bacillota bacterium]
MEKGKTYMARPADIERNWYVVDAEDKVLGRLAAEVATILRGKHKPQFTPHMDTGDFVIIVNAEKIKLTGKKWEKKTYYWHTSYPGGLRSRTATELRSRQPEEIIRKAVWGMMPKNSLGRNQMKKLKIYAGPEHPHMAQMPEPLEAREAVK